MKINNIYGFVFGVGCFARFVEEYDRGGATGSSLRAARLLLKAAIQAAAGLGSMFPGLDEAEASAGGYAIDTRHAVGIAASTVKYAGLGFKPFYLAGDGFMHVAVLKRPLFLLATSLPAALIGKSRGNRSARHMRCRSLEIKLRAGEKFLLDGDIRICNQDSIKVETGPEITFLVP